MYILNVSANTPVTILSAETSANKSVWIKNNHNCNLLYRKPVHTMQTDV